MQVSPTLTSRCQVFGRRPVMLGCVALFALGGALAGAAQSMNMLIAARGTCHANDSRYRAYITRSRSRSGCRRDANNISNHSFRPGDSTRERDVQRTVRAVSNSCPTVVAARSPGQLPKFSMWALGGCVGPLIGGALARPTTWRWIFCKSTQLGLDHDN